jgi:hypothetical protein
MKCALPPCLALCRRPKVQLPFLWSSRRTDPEQLNRVTRAGRFGSSGQSALRSRSADVVSRGLCRVKAFALASVAAGQREVVLRNLLMAWAPFANPEYRVVMRGEQALAFAWDRSGTGGEARSGAVPETLMQQPLAQSGVRLVAGLDGHEGQVWHDGWLLASRWWPAAPEPADWQLFVRSLPAFAQDVPSQPPAPVPAVWQSRPWATAKPLEDLGRGHTQLERLATLAVAVCVTAMGAGLAKQFWTVLQDREVLQTQADQARLAAMPLLAARDRALALREGSDALLRELTAVQPLEVLDHLARALPSTGVLLKDFELTGLKLRLGLELTGDVPRSTIIKTLQAGGWFTEVVEQRESPGKPWAAFDITLASPAPPTRTVAAPPASGGQPDPAVQARP